MGDGCQMRPQWTVRWSPPVAFPCGLGFLVTWWLGSNGVCPGRDGRGEPAKVTLCLFSWQSLGSPVASLLPNPIGPGSHKALQVQGKKHRPLLLGLASQYKKPRGMGHICCCSCLCTSPAASGLPSPKPGLFPLSIPLVYTQS